MTLLLPACYDTIMRDRDHMHEIPMNWPMCTQPEPSIVVCTFACICLCMQSFHIYYIMCAIISSSAIVLHFAARLFADKHRSRAFSLTVCLLPCGMRSVQEQSAAAAAAAADDDGKSPRSASSSTQPT